MRLTANDFAALSRLLDAVENVSAEARPAWIDGLDAADAPFKAMLQELLTRGGGVETDDFLRRLPAFAPGDDVAQIDACGRALAAGAIVGPYRLVREIGRGGMASVWLAARADASMDRLTALKLPFADGTSRRFAERFARERDILAGLSHGHIARLYDAGVSVDGQPYLSMEYVEGQPITDYCDARRLDVQERITLFLGVLGAIRHAHLGLVLHRDLKPSNILVTAAGHVMLLDFGIAKLLVEGEAHESDLTRLGGRAMTLAYASPEQLAGNALSTASDVYSLGVVLYELLTGKRPYRLKENSRLALENAIAEADVLRPSLSITAVATVSRRAPTARALARSLKGDLDTIVLKALKKEPLERYRTADALAEDLERYQASKPILARSDSAAYFVRRFIGRHRLTVAIATIATVALMLAGAVSIWEAHVARAQAARAEHEARKAEAVQGFLLDLFRTNTDAQPDPVRARQTTAREMLDLGALRANAHLKDQPEAAEAIDDTLADMYHALGLDLEATQIEGARVEALRRAYGDGDPRVAAALLTYAEGVYHTDGYLRAIPLLAEAQQLLDGAGDTRSLARGQLLLDQARFRLAAAPAVSRHSADAAVAFFTQHPSPDDWLVSAYLYAARSRYVLGDYVGAEAEYRAALGALATLASPPLSTELTAVVGLAEAETKLGRIADAERDFRSILAKSRQRNGPSHLDTVQVETRLGAFLHATSRREEGRRLLVESVRQVEHDSSLNQPNLTLQVERNLGVSLLADGRLEPATALLSKNAAERRTRDPSTTTLALTLRDLAVAMTALGQYPQAEALAAEATATWQSAVGGTAAPEATEAFRLVEAQLHLARGDPGAALRYLPDPVLAAPMSTSGSPVDPVNVEVALSRAYSMLGRADDALRTARHAVDVVQRAAERVHYSTLEADALTELGRVERLAGQPGAARPALERAVALRAVSDDPASPWLAAARVQLAACLLDLGERPAAKKLLEQARSALATHPQVSAEFTDPLRVLSARLRP